MRSVSVGPLNFFSKKLTDVSCSALTNKFPGKKSRLVSVAAVPRPKKEKSCFSPAVFQQDRWDAAVFEMICDFFSTDPILQHRTTIVNEQF